MASVFSLSIGLAFWKSDFKGQFWVGLVGGGDGWGIGVRIFGIVVPWALAPAFEISENMHIKAFVCCERSSLGWAETLNVTSGSIPYDAKLYRPGAMREGICI